MFMNPTHLPDDIYQDIIDEARAAHADEIDLIRTLIQRKANTVHDDIALDGFTDHDKQIIVNARFSGLFHEVISALYIQPALQAAESSIQVEAYAPNSNGTARTRRVQPTQSQPPMGFQTRKK
jgi:hypothetical protein